MAVCFDTHPTTTLALLLCITNNTPHCNLSSLLVLHVLYPDSSPQHYQLQLMLHFLFEGWCAKEAWEGRLLPWLRGKADVYSLWGRPALEMVAMHYPFPFFLWFCRFVLGTLGRCNSFELGLIQGGGEFWACIQVAIMLFRVFKCLHIDLFMKGMKAELGRSPEECHRSMAADKKLICWLAEDCISNRNAATYWVFSVRGVNLP